MRIRWSAALFLASTLVSGGDLRRNLQIVSCHVVSKDGKALLEQGRWLGLHESSSGSSLVLGPPRIKPAGSKSPHEDEFDVLPPKGIKHQIRFWLQGPGYIPGKLESGKVKSTSIPFPNQMTAQLGNQQISVSAVKSANGSYILTVSYLGRTYHLLKEENPDPDNNGWKIVWVGDLNRDGCLDFVLELKRYMTLETVVFLGNQAGGFSLAASDAEDWD